MSTGETTKPPETNDESHHEPHVPAPSRRALRTMAVVRCAAWASSLRSLDTPCGPSGAQAGRSRRARGGSVLLPDASADPLAGARGVPHLSHEPEPIPEERRNAPAALPAQANQPAPSASSPSNVTPVTLSEEKQRAVGFATSVVESAAVGDRFACPRRHQRTGNGPAQARVRAPGFVEQVAVRQTGRARDPRSTARVHLQP